MGNDFLKTFADLKELYAPMFSGIDFIYYGNKTIIKITTDKKDALFYYDFIEVMEWEE